MSRLSPQVNTDMGSRNSQHHLANRHRFFSLCCSVLGHSFERISVGICGTGGEETTEWCMQ